MDISSEQGTYLEDDAYSIDDGVQANLMDNSLEYDMNGIAWREIEKYRERKELESLLKDDLVDDFDINSVWE